MVAQVTANTQTSFGSSGVVSTTGPDGTGGISPAGGPGLIATTTTGGPTVFHAGGVSPNVAAYGTDSTPVTTETYCVEVFVPCSATLTGVAVMNGSGAAGNITVGLCDNTGTPIAAAKSATTAQSGTNAFQRIPFATPYTAVGPARYFIQVQFDDGTTARFRTHIVGTFNAQKQTAQTYGTFAAIAVANSFTTVVGPVCSTY